MNFGVVTLFYRLQPFLYILFCLTSIVPLQFYEIFFRFHHIQKGEFMLE